MNLKWKMQQCFYFRDRQMMRQFFASQFHHEKRGELNRIFTNRFSERGREGALKLGIHIPNGFDTSLLAEVFCQKIYDVPGFLPTPNDVVVDVGANVGDWAVYCSKVMGARKVIAFEPLMQNVELMARFLSENNVGNVEVYKFALSDRSFTSTRNHNGLMLSLKEKGTIGEEICFRTLDSFDLQPSILKIDVEGYECHVLSGAVNTIRRSKPRIIIEVHSRRLKKSSLSLLYKFGYKVVAKSPNVSGRYGGFVSTIFLQADNA